jgi:predicted DsbA family dithiol-disulfide isomerase
MDFTGQVLVDFETFDVWRLYTTALQASRDRSVRVDVTWEEFLGKDVDPNGVVPPRIRLLGACAAVRDAYPDNHQRFVQALLTLIFQEKDDPKKDTTLAVAARVAGVNGDEVIARAIHPGLDLLMTGSRELRQRGVTAVPTVVSNGPPLHVKLTGAANYGSAVLRLDVINRMLHDDGIWEMTKPSPGR